MPPGIMPHLTALVSVKMRKQIWEMKGMSSQPNSCTPTLSALPVWERFSTESKGAETSAQKHLEGKLRGGRTRTV